MFNNMELPSQLILSEYDKRNRFFDDAYLLVSPVVTFDGQEGLFDSNSIITEYLKVRIAKEDFLKIMGEIISKEALEPQKKYYRDLDRILTDVFDGKWFLYEKSLDEISKTTGGTIFHNYRAANSNT